MKRLLLVWLITPFTIFAQTNTFPASGNAGIGTTSPETPLHIFQSERHKGLTITESDNSVKIYLHLAKFDDGREYGFLDLGGNTKLRGNGELSYFDGKVGIGTTNPDAELAVKGKIHTQEVKVDLAGTIAPDYVFKEDYHLRSLEEVQTHIKEKGHLPGIPSAREMEEEVVNLKEMNLKLLEKVEELTLYIIEEQKEIKDLQQKIMYLKS